MCGPNKVNFICRCNERQGDVRHVIRKLVTNEIYVIFGRNVCNSHLYTFIRTRVIISAGNDDNRRHLTSRVSVTMTNIFTLGANFCGLPWQRLFISGIYYFQNNLSRLSLRLIYKCVERFIRVLHRCAYVQRRTCIMCERVISNTCVSQIWERASRTKRINISVAFKRR